MARKAREQQEHDAAAGVYESSPSYPNRFEIIDTTAELVDGSPLMPSAVERDGSSGGAEVRPPSQYRVLATQYVMARGGRTILRAGKIIDAHNFDIAALASQGVQLEALAGA